MKATRTVTTELNGKITEIKVELTCDLQNKIAYADGDNVNLGIETYEGVEITVTVNGKVVAFSRYAPEILTRLAYRNSYDKLVAAGAYARLGDYYIGQEMHDTITALIAAAASEAETTEYTKIKQIEVAKKEQEWEAIRNYKSEAHGPGWCSKCRSYCYGDCEAN